MDINQLLKIGDFLGMNLSFVNGVLKEENADYENYIQLEFTNGNIEYSEVNFERKASPEKENTLAFSDEDKAVSYFLIKLLKKHYFNEIFSPGNAVYDIKTVNELVAYLNQLGVSGQHYSFTTLKPQSIHGETNANNEIVISYIDKNNQKKFSTMPLPLDRGIFAFYRLTYSLSLLKTVEEKLTQNGLLQVPFTDEEIELFIK